MTALYKYLNDDGVTPIQNFQWTLPTRKGPGKWLEPIKGELVACENGYHVCREQDLLECSGQALWTVEVRGGQVAVSDKLVVRQARLIQKLDWNARTQRLFACDCAERALARVEKPDERSVKAVAVARKFADGEVDAKELAAAWDAAWAAAWDAAWASALAASRAEAWDAVLVAARDAAWDAERKWQIKRLLDYANGKVK